jgi:hypothetical protein
MMNYSAKISFVQASIAASKGAPRTHQTMLKALVARL